VTACEYIVRKLDEPHRTEAVSKASLAVRWWRRRNHRPRQGLLVTKRRSCSPLPASIYRSGILRAIFCDCDVSCTPSLCLSLCFVGQRPAAGPRRHCWPFRIIAHRVDSAFSNAHLPRIYGDINEGLSSIIVVFEGQCRNGSVQGRSWQCWREADFVTAVYLRRKQIWLGIRS
jgi:hypothetical protein